MRLEDIKRRRKNLGMTQAELAELSGVSQSMIAKIEAGKLNPTYDNAKKVFNALDRVGQEAGKKASDLMTRAVVAVEDNDTIDKAIKLMRKKQLSNLPVMRKGKLIGMISEKVVVDNLGKKDLAKCMVSEIMSEAPPTIPENSPLQMVSELLRYNPLLVVVSGAEISGVITKSDLLDLAVA
jgi:predicted transcriptional regulator